MISGEFFGRVGQVSLFGDELLCAVFSPNTLFLGRPNALPRNLPTPGRAQHPEPVAVCELLEACVVVAALAQDREELLQAGGVAEIPRHLSAVKVRAEAHPFYTNALDEVVHVPGQRIERRVFVVAAVLAQEGDGEVHADHPVRVPDGSQLPVGKVACRRAEGVRVGVCRHQRRLRRARYIPEPALVQVGEVYQDSQPVALAHQLSTGVRQAGARVGQGRKPEGDAAGVVVGPAPHEAERAQPGLLGPAGLFGVRDVAREEPSSEATVPGPRQVDVPDIAAFEETATLAAPREVQVQQRVVVTVKDLDTVHPANDTGRSGHSDAKKRGRYGDPAYERTSPSTSGRSGRSPRSRR